MLVMNECRSLWYGVQLVSNHRDGLIPYKRLQLIVQSAHMLHACCNERMLRCPVSQTCQPSLGSFIFRANLCQQSCNFTPLLIGSSLHGLRCSFCKLCFCPTISCLPLFCVRHMSVKMYIQCVSLVGTSEKIHMNSMHDNLSSCLVVRRLFWGNCVFFTKFYHCGYYAKVLLLRARSLHCTKRWGSPEEKQTLFVTTQDSSLPTAVRKSFCAAGCAAAGGTARSTKRREPP